jgi:hypothetical protein
MLADDPQISLRTVYMLHDFVGPALVGAASLVYKTSTLVASQQHTLCSMTSFLQTLSKYPSHMRLNRSRISCSTSSCSSFDREGKEPSASRSVAEDKVPGSEEVGICFEEGGISPR